MHPLIEDAEREGLSRRRFLRNVFLTAGGVAASTRLDAQAKGFGEYLRAITSRGASGKTRP
jgi:hypothetical protein